MGRNLQHDMFVLCRYTGTRVVSMPQSLAKHSGNKTLCTRIEIRCTGKHTTQQYTYWMTPIVCHIITVLGWYDARHPQRVEPSQQHVLCNAVEYSKVERSKIDRTDPRILRTRDLSSTWNVNAVNSDMIFGHVSGHTGHFERMRCCLPIAHYFHHVFFVFLSGSSGARLGSYGQHYCSFI